MLSAQGFTSARLLIAVIVLAGLAGPVRGADTYWQHDPATPGDWFNDDNWDNGVPGAEDDARVYNGGTALISGGSARAYWLGVDDSRVEQTGGENTLGWLSVYGYGSYLLAGTGQLSAGSAYVASSATFSHSAGTSIIAGELECNGIYELSGTGSLSAAVEDLYGYYDDAEFRQSGGTNAAGYVHAKNYEYTGGAFSVSEGLVLGGTLDCAGAAVTLTVGDGAGADFRSATFANVSAASIRMGAGSVAVFAADFDPYTELGGYSSAGITHFEGMDLDVPPGHRAVLGDSWTNRLRCAGEVRAVPTYRVTLRGGLEVVAGGDVDIGWGDIRADGTDWTISGGSLSCQAVYVGDSAPGALFTQTGGEWTIHGCLHVGGRGGDELVAAAGQLTVVPEYSDGWPCIFVGDDDGSGIECILRASGASLHAPRLLVGPWQEPWADMAAVGPGRLVMAGSTIRLFGGNRPESFGCGGRVEGFGQIVAERWMLFSEGSSIVAAGGVLELLGEVSGRSEVTVEAGAELRTRGMVAGVVSNAGTLTAAGGSLSIVGPSLVNTGVLANAPGASLFVRAESLDNSGSIRAHAAGAVSFDVSVTNPAGQSVELLGGTFAAPSLVNADGAVVRGFGTLTADVDNQPGGVADFFGDTQIVGELANAAAGTVGIRNGDLLITGHTTNHGLIKALNGSVYFEGGLTNSGEINLDPALGVVSGDLVLTETGYVVADAGSKLQLLGDFDNRSQAAGLFDLTEATVSFHGLVAAGPQELEVAGVDCGADAGGYEDNFAFGELLVESAVVRLADAHDNQPAWEGAEALYVDGLVIGPRATIHPQGLRLYYRNGGAIKRFYPGDCDLGGLVDYVDLGILATYYDLSGMTWAQGDFTGNGLVDYVDLGILATYYGSGLKDGATGPAAVPGPVTLLLLTVGAVAVRRRRRRGALAD